MTPKYSTAINWRLPHLPPRIVFRTVREPVGRGKQKTMTERREPFRADSVVRPLIAENLALGRKWYAGFVTLMTKINGATGKPYRTQIPFEQKGLHAMMAETKMWDQDGERLVVEAVHQAMRRRMAQIRSETDGGKAAGLTQATKNRWERFRERLRLALCGAKTESDPPLRAHGSLQSRREHSCPARGLATCAARDPTGLALGPRPRVTRSRQLCRQG